MKALLSTGKLSAKSCASLMLSVASIGLVACSGSGSDSSRPLEYELSARQFFTDEDLETVTFPNGEQINFTENVGSGAFRSTQEDSNIFYTITDRGPSFDCADSQAVVGIASLCGVGGSGTVFPLPNLAPKITKWKLSGVGTELSLEQLESITLNNGQGSTMTGLPNYQSQASSETPYNKDGVLLSKDQNGIDPEALVKLENGRFWVAEEYGPSLLLVDVDGRVLERQVPAGSAADYPTAQTGIPVGEGFLPAALSRRENGKGIEALALSPSEDYLYYVMQGPLGDADDGSRVVRIGKLSLSDDGSISSFDGEYLYRLDPSSSYADRVEGLGDLENGEYLPQSEITINEAVAVEDDYLVVVEQGRNVSKYYKVSLADAVSITGTQWQNATGSAAPENQYLIEDVPFVTKQLGFNNLSLPLPNGIDPLGEQIEGFALLSANFAAVINDNDWGLNGERGRIAVLPLGAFVVSSTAPSRPSLGYDISASYSVPGVIDLAADVINSRLYAVDGQQAAVSIIDVTEPLSPQAATVSLDLSAAAADAGITIGAATSVSVYSNYLAVALTNATAGGAGIVALYQTDDFSLLGTYAVGVDPVEVAFGLLGGELLVANAGEPRADYSVDPEGTITLIDLSDGVDAASVTELDFTEFNTGGSRSNELPDDVRIYGPGATVAQDLEPQSISFALDTVYAYVSLQENNAVAVVNLTDKTIESIVALGTKDFGLTGNELDVNDNGIVSIDSWPGVYGMYMPDQLAAYHYNGQRYFVTANQGQGRNYTGFSEEVRANALLVDGSNPSAAAAADSGALGRLVVSDQAGDTDNDGAVEEISAFGARSFSIWEEDGKQVYDSGSDIARSTLAILGPVGFNDSDNRSDEKGAEPKGLALVASGGRVYAALTLKATGGLMIYDITSPYGVQFIQYVNNRDFISGGDIGSQDVIGFALNAVGYLAVANTTSGNVRIFEIATQ